MDVNDVERRDRVMSAAKIMSPSDHNHLTQNDGRLQLLINNVNAGRKHGIGTINF
jgi:hypothetical protein